MADKTSPTTTSFSQKPQFTNRLAYTLALALLIFAVVPVSIMGLVGYLQARSLLKEQTATQLYNFSHSQVEAFENSIKTKEIRLKRIAHQTDFINVAEHLIRGETGEYPDQLFTYYDAINRPFGVALFDDFLLVAPDGSIYAASNDAWLGISLAKSPFYTKITEEGTIGIYNLEPIFTKEFTIYSSTPLSSKGGDELGVLIGITKEEAIRGFLRGASSFNSASSAYIITQGESYIGIDPYTEELAIFIPSQEQKKSIASFFKTEYQYSTVEFKNYSGIEVVSQIHKIDSAKLELALEIPREAALGQLSSLAPFSFFLFLATLLVMGTVLWFANNRIVKPLHSLSQTTHAFSKGNWQARSPLERNDEIGALAYSFNEMADELSSLYKSLKEQVDERTKYISAASEVAQKIISTFNLDELLEKAPRLIVKKLGYRHVNIFMIDRSGEKASLKSAYGSMTSETLKDDIYFNVDANSIIGWVSANNRPCTLADFEKNLKPIKNELQPNTHAEIGIPIAIGSIVFGVLNVQSNDPKAFDDPARIAILLTLSNQIATAIQNVNYFETSDVNLHELDRLYRTSHEIFQEKTKKDVFETSKFILKNAPFNTVIFTPKDNGTEIYAVSDPDYDVSRFTLPNFLAISPSSIIESIKEEEIINLETTTSLHKDIIDISQKMGCQAISFLPMMRNGKVEALVMIGSRHKARLTHTAIQPYITLIEIISVTLDKINETEITRKRLAEMDAIFTTHKATSVAVTTQDVNSLYPILHEQIRQILGDYSFALFLYDEASNSLRIPYAYEDGKVSSFPAIPMGEGITSIIIRTKQALMIVENTEERTSALGAKMVGPGRPAKSWLGSPLLVKDKIIGAIIVQDPEKEKSFNEDSLRFINILATQVSGAIYNIQLLKNSQQRAIQLESAAEIARDISSSLHLDELLSNAVTMLRDKFSFYHAAVFLIDRLGEYAVIREATGDAGAELKRNRHKLGVGSKSIVGYVASRGENLIIQNTTKDATHYANPLLPETRAEAAIPLKVGERILGVLDVQSTHSYAFPEETLQTLSIIADQLAVAVINTELFAETQEHLSQHRLLHHITTSAASGTTLEEALRGAVQGLQVTLGGDRVSILLIDDKGENLIIKAAIGYSEEDIASITIPLGTGITGWVAKNQKLLRVDDTKKDPRYILVSSNTRSELAIPLSFRKELLGVLNVESEDLAAYDKHDEEMLGTLAGSLAAIIANTRLVQRVRRRAERERTLYEITSKIRRSTNVQTILSTTVKELANAVDARHAQVKIEIENNQETESEHE